MSGKRARTCECCRVVSNREAVVLTLLITLSTAGVFLALIFGVK